MFPLLFLLTLVGVQAASVQVVRGNNIYTNGNCVYVDGQIYEHGVARPASDAEMAAVTQWQQQMAQWGVDFNKYMQDKMAHMFDHNYQGPPEPKTPQPICLCSVQYCDPSSVPTTDVPKTNLLRLN